LDLNILHLLLLNWVLYLILERVGHNMVVGVLHNLDWGCKVLSQGNHIRGVKVENAEACWCTQEVQIAFCNFCAILGEDHLLRIEVCRNLDEVAFVEFLT